ncbi:hypothetical protein [Tessaracoccus sp.]
MSLRLDNPLVVTALELATFAHDGQSHSGAPFVDRLVRIASRLDDPRDQVVALLHEVLARTTITGTNLYDDGMPAELILDIASLTQGVTEPYNDFMTRIRANGDRPVRVKNAVFEDQSDAKILSVMPSQQREMVLAVYAHDYAAFTARAA